MSIYLNNINELVSKKRTGNNTRRGLPRGHIYKVNIYGNEYFKFQVKRDGKSNIVYFKRKKDATKFKNSVRLSKSLKLSTIKFKKKNALRSLNK